MITLHSIHSNRSNAILVKIVGPTYVIITDFGNLRRLSFKEMEEQYTPGYFKTFREWMTEREEVTKQSLQEIGTEWINHNQQAG